MAIVVRCECGKELRTKDENAGMRARCPACQRELIVPQPEPVFDEEFAPLHESHPTTTSGKAIASLILGICSFVTCFFTGLPALFLGIFALNDISNPKKHVTGRGMAISGIVLGGLTTFLMLPLVLIALLLPAVQAAREAARRAQCTNNLKQIGLAMFNYASAHDCYPPAATYDADGKPLVSWRVLLLPYLEQNSLYNQFHLDEPWDSPNNKPLADRMPNVFQCPSDVLPAGMTAYAVIVDPRSLFTGQPQGVSIATVTDGTSNTFMVVEAATPIPWSKPDDLSLTSNDLMLGMGSKHPGGLNASMADGSVRFIKNSVSLSLLKALVTRNGNEPVMPP
jgi:prepilin-type processing-associated H-X9-DG protein